MVDKLDWTALPKDKDQLEEIEEASEEAKVATEEDKVATEEAKVATEEAKVDSAVIETTLETQETQLLFWVKMIKTLRRVLLELLQERKFFSDDVLNNLSFGIN